MHAITFPFQAAEPTADAFVFAVAVNDEILLPVGQLAPGFFGRDFFALAEVEQAAHPPSSVDPWLDRAVAQRFAGIGNHQIEIDVDHPAETPAGFACTEGAVERKEIRHGVAVGDIAVRTMQMIAEGLAAPFLLRQKQIQAALAVMERLFERVQDAFLVRTSECEAIDHDL